MAAIEVIQGLTSRAIRGHYGQSRTATHLEREVGRLHLERLGLE
jgi:hypothetical protein